MTDNATHTPGPWAVYQNAICTNDGKANEIAKITRYGVWMGDGTPYGPRNPIGDGNERLIAAAPDLLAALQYVLLADKYDGALTMGSAALSPAIRDKIERAIAQATGAPTE